MSDNESNLNQSSQSTQHTQATNQQGTQSYPSPLNFPFPSVNSFQPNLQPTNLIFSQSGNQGSSRDHQQDNSARQSSSKQADKQPLQTQTTQQTIRPTAHHQQSSKQHQPSIEQIVQQATNNVNPTSEQDNRHYNIPGLQELIEEAIENGIQYTNIYELVLGVVKSKITLPEFGSTEFERFHGQLNNMQPHSSSAFFPNQNVMRNLRSDLQKSNYTTILNFGKVAELANGSGELHDLIQANHYIMGATLLKKSVIEKCLSNNCLDSLPAIEESVCNSSVNPFDASVAKEVKKTLQSKKDNKFVQNSVYGNNKRPYFQYSQNDNGNKRGNYGNNRGNFRGRGGRYYGGNNNNNNNNGSNFNGGNNGNRNQQTPESTNKM